MKFLAKVVARFKRRSRIEEGRPSPPVDPATAALVIILTTRVLLHDQLDQAARNGMVPDALPQANYANHLAELAELRRELAEQEQGYRACASQLDGMVPQPPPEAEAPAPVSPQNYPRMAQLLGKRPPGLPRARH